MASLAAQQTAIAQLIANRQPAFGPSAGAALAGIAQGIGTGIAGKRKRESDAARLVATDQVAELRRAEDVDFRDDKLSAAKRQNELQNQLGQATIDLQSTIASIPLRLQEGEILKQDNLIQEQIDRKKATRKNFEDQAAVTGRPVVKNFEFNQQFPNEQPFGNTGDVTIPNNLSQSESIASQIKRQTSGIVKGFGLGGIDFIEVTIKGQKLRLLPTGRKDEFLSPDTNQILLFNEAIDDFVVLQ